MVDQVIYNCPCQCSRCRTIYFSGVQLSGGYIKKTLKDKSYDPSLRYKPEINDVTDIWKDLPFLNIEFDCPNCGKGNLINTFLIDLIENSIEAFKQVPLDKLIELQNKLIRNAQQTSSFTIYDFENSKNDILEVTPELQCLKDFIPKTRNEAYTLIGVIVAIITLILPLLKGETTEKPQIEQVINQTQTVNIYNLPSLKNGKIKPDLRKKPVLNPFKKPKRPK